MLGSSRAVLALVKNMFSKKMAIQNLLKHFCFTAFVRWSETTCMMYT